MAKSISLTIPDRVHAAASSEAAAWEMDVSAWLKQLLITATQQPGGVSIKLVAPPLPPQDLPLMDAAGVKVETTLEGLR